MRCGPPPPDDQVETFDAVIVVETVSTSTRAVESGVKLHGCFSLPSVRRDLVACAGSGTVAHHRPTEPGDGAGAGEIVTRILHGGTRVLDPPELTIDLDGIGTAIG